MNTDLFQQPAAPKPQQRPVIPVEEEWWFEPLRLVHQVFDGRIVAVELEQPSGFGPDVRTVSRPRSSSHQISVAATQRIVTSTGTLVTNRTTL